MFDFSYRSIKKGYSQKLWNILKAYHFGPSKGSFSKNEYLFRKKDINRYIYIENGQIKCFSFSFLNFEKMPHSGGCCGGCSISGFIFILVPPNSYMIMVWLSLPGNCLLFCTCTMSHKFFYDGKFFFWLSDSNSGLGSVMLWLSRGGVTTEGCLPLKVPFHQR